MSSMAILRFVSAWKVVLPLSHLSASTSRARWPPPPALRAVRPSTGPAWTKEIPRGHGQGQSVHLDTGILEPRCYHRSGFGRREGPWLPALGSLSDLLQNPVLSGFSGRQADCLERAFQRPPPRAGSVLSPHQGQTTPSLCQKEA